MPCFFRIFFIYHKLKRFCLKILSAVLLLIIFRLRRKNCFTNSSESSIVSDRMFMITNNSHTDRKIFFFWNYKNEFNLGEGFPQRVVLAALPLLTIFPRLRRPLAVGLEGVKFCARVHQVQNGEVRHLGRPLFEVGMAAACLATTILVPRVGFVLTNVQDMLDSSKRLRLAIASGDLKAAVSPSLHFANDLFLLGCLATASPQYLAIAFAAQIASQLYRAFIEYRRGGHSLEVGSCLLMAAIRFHQLSHLHHFLERKKTNTCMALPPVAQEMREREAIEKELSFKEFVGDHPYEIHKIGDHYIVERDLTDSIRVDVNYLPSPDGRCGPVDFELIFHVS